MISTIETRAQQLRHGFYQSGSGPEQLLILGSCRTLAFLSYLVKWNDGEGQNRFTLRRIDPCDLHWNEAGENVDVEPILAALETDERILSVLRDSTIFIHEHLGNYGMFNTSPGAPKNIYQFGMAAPVDISIPNWHDHFILENDFADYGKVPEDYQQRGEAEIEKFCALCDLTSFPEMADYVRGNWRTIRFFWRPNHTSAAFTWKIFQLMNDKFLHLNLSQEFQDSIRGEDIFRTPHTDVSANDTEGYGITWK